MTTNKAEVANLLMNIFVMFVVLVGFLGACISVGILLAQGLNCLFGI